MNIVIIDDGVNKELLNIGKVEFDLEINQKLELVNRKNKRKLVCSHGTVCAAIIAMYAPEATFSSIKVISQETGIGMKGQLIIALKWCLDNKARLINISLGTTQCSEFDDIRDIIAQLYRNGCIIIAAYDNRNIYTMPASLECTIGVKCNPIINKRYEIIEDKYERFVVTNGKHVIKMSNNQNYISKQCNSFATPYITAVVHNILSLEYIANLGDIWNLLSGNNGGYICNFPDFIDNAIIVNISNDEWLDLFYFHTMSVCHYSNFKIINEINQNVYIVILINNSYQLGSLIDNINISNNFIKGILCCCEYNDFGSSSSCSLYNRIWYESYYLKKYVVYNEIKSIDIPLIYIYGKRKLIIVLLKVLREKFINKGYNIKIIGEFQRAYLYGFEYINNKDNRQIIIHNVYKRFDCDIIICGIDSRVIDHDEEDICFCVKTEIQSDFIGDNYLVINADSGVDNYANIIFNKILTSFI